MVSSTLCQDHCWFLLFSTKNHDRGNLHVLNSREVGNPVHVFPCWLLRVLQSLKSTGHSINTCWWTASQMPQSPPSHQMWDAGVLCFSSQRGQQLDYWAPNHKEAGRLLADRGLQVKDKKADLKSHITSNNGKTLWNLNIKGLVLFTEEWKGKEESELFLFALHQEAAKLGIYVHTHNTDLISSSHWPPDHPLLTLEGTESQKHPVICPESHSW